MTEVLFKIADFILGGLLEKWRQRRAAMTIETAQGLGVLLAAGEGTRMRSSLPKPLHEIAGRSMAG